MTSAGYYLATSSKALMRIRVVEKSEPILISPRDFSPFIRYCEQQLLARKSVLHAGETRAGVAPSKNHTKH